MTSVTNHMHRARAELAAELEMRDPTQRVALMAEACIETGGSLVPAGLGNRGAHYAEISCLGVYHSGNDIPEAIANWIKAVHRMECDGSDLDEVAA